VSLKSVLKKWTLRVSAILLPLSIGLIVVVITLMMLGDLRLPRFVLSCIAFLCGSVMWYAGILLKNRARFFFAATFLVLTGIMMLILDAGFISVSLPVVWPLFMIFVGIAFLVSGVIRYRKLHAMYLTPALAFLGLGILFLLFSTHLIQLSLIRVVLWAFPIVFLPLAVTLIIWFARKGSGNRESDV
jgi:hypothetical protein